MTTLLEAIASDVDTYKAGVYAENLDGDCFAVVADFNELYKVYQGEKDLRLVISGFALNDAKAEFLAAHHGAAFDAAFPSIAADVHAGVYGAAVDVKFGPIFGHLFDDGFIDWLANNGHISFRLAKSSGVRETALAAAWIRKVGKARTK